MIIDVKAMKATGPERSSNPYILTEKQPSRAPVVLSLLLTGMVLYLKSVFPGWAQEASEPESEPEPEDPKSAPNLVLIPSENILEPAFDPKPVGTPVAFAGGHVAAGGELGGLQPTSFFVIESPELEQLEISVPQIVPSISPSGPHPANDNGASRASSTGGSGNSAEETELSDDVLNSDGQGLDPEGDLDLILDYDTNPFFDTNPFDDEDDGYPGEDDDDDETGNRAPKVTSPVYLHDVFGGMAAFIGLSELLRNASDPDDDALSIANLTVSSGTLIQQADGWTLSDGMLGPITLTYEITDGALSIVQHAYLRLLKNPLFGTPDSDVLVGTEYADDIYGLGSDDNIEGLGGDDTIAGAAGNDLIAAGSGDDQLFGGDGDDTLSGGDGDDTLFGGGGSDLLEGGDGNDLLSGQEGEDRVFAGAGDDTIVGALDVADDIYDGGEGIDTLDYSAAQNAIDVNLAQGTARGAEIGVDTVTSVEVVLTGKGDDLIFGSEGSERLSAGSGNDRIADGGGRDTVDAGVGDDTVLAALDAAADDYNGGAGTDTLDYAATSSGVLINLNEQTATGIEVGTDTISGFEAIVGGAGDDHFVITNVPVSLQGGEGNDLFEFEAVTGTSAGAHVIHDILDFMVGDRIKVSKYEIFNEVINSVEDQFKDIYGNDVAKEELPIRIRHEQTDNIRQTLIDVDFDQDQIYEMTIAISGDHVLMTVENA